MSIDQLSSIQMSKHSDEDFQLERSAYLDQSAKELAFFVQDKLAIAETPNKKIGQAFSNKNDDSISNRQG